MERRAPTARRQGILTPFESARRRTWADVQGDLGALAVQGVVVALLLLSSRGISANPVPEPDQAARFLAPLRQPAPRPQAERISWIGISGIGGGLPATGTGRPVPQGITPAAPPAPPADTVAPPAEPEPDRAFSEIEVDSVAAIDPEGGGPVYPQALIDQHIEGTVLLRFVVDTAGRIDLGTIRILRSDHPGFDVAVREALPRMRYRAAQLNGQRVRQLVEQPFTFRIR